MPYTVDQALNRLRGNVAGGLSPLMCGDQEDWCVLRLDSDNATMEVYWSEPNQPYRITSSAQNEPVAGGYRGWGGHAEMNMIRDFANVLANYGRIPNLVEIFISRSPCSRSQAFNVNMTQYPIGCGAKLQTLVQENPAVTIWKVVFDEWFTGTRGAPDLNATYQAERGVAQLNRNARVEALPFRDYTDRMIRA